MLEVIWESRTKQVYNNRIGVSWVFYYTKQCFALQTSFHVFYSCRAKVFVKKQALKFITYTRLFIRSVSFRVAEY